MLLHDLIILCSNCFNQVRRYDQGDQAISTIIKFFPQNNELPIVLTKVVLINSIYGTAIYDTIKIAEHICSLNFDQKVQQGDISIISDIRSGHGILTRKNNQRDLYSFATKYASWHAQTHFPMYDNLVKRLLLELNECCHFHQRFNQRDLYDYANFKAVVDSLVNFCNLQNFKYKKFDQGLWVFAKFTYKRNELPNDVIEKIEDAASVT